jgi:hypothetical protein
MGINYIAAALFTPTLDIRIAWPVPGERVAYKLRNDQRLRSTLADTLERESISHSQIHMKPPWHGSTRSVEALGAVLDPTV